MKTKVLLKRIIHREKSRIALIFRFDNALKAHIQSISGCMFSSTHKCFYVDDNDENLRMILKSLNGIADIDISEIAKQERLSEKEGINTDNPGKVSVNTDDSSEGSYEQQMSNWQKKQIEPDRYGGDAKTMKYQYDPGKPGPVEFRINEKDGLLVVKFLGRYDPAWVDEIKTYGSCYYDWKAKEWLLRWSKLSCDSLADYFGSRGIKVNVIRPVVEKELASQRKEIFNEIRCKELVAEALVGLDSLKMYLDENRYSPKTRESYISMLDFFFRYFSPKKPFEITDDDISKFIYDFIIRLGYSPAYQNQMVSAIKTYYLISGKGKVNPVFLERPRRSRSLPKVFSKEEVSRILNSTRNLKHKMILWMIYSCGLRRSEVTNIRLIDLDRDRRILHIREGKGRVDRIVPVSEKVWDKIDEYVRGYSPREYLFEGQTGGRYSSESVYRVFKEALIRAGIKKEVGVHSLRHSYATHLHESGLDIRYIQELLGHKSTRTTEIYTHVSRRNLVAVRSPIEDLDVK